MKLSPNTESLWAKLSRDRSDLYLPLCMHMEDSAGTARRLWDDWLSSGIKTFLIRTFPEAKRLVVFLAAVHDIGKAIPVFQFKPRHAPPVFRHVRERMERAGLGIGEIAGNDRLPPHALASYAILVRHGVSREFAIIAGSHHGQPPSRKDATDIKAYASRIGFTDKIWLGMQDELYNHALTLAEVEDERILASQTKLPAAAQALLSGLVIMADWIASGAELFRLVSLDSRPEVDRNRAAAAWDGLGLPPRTDPPDEDKYGAMDLYKDRFEIENPRSIQSAALETAMTISDPGIFIIEAPMGEGKTEAALAAAEIFAAKTGRGGLYFALPTQATSDGIFPRITRWGRHIILTGGRRSIQLAHGKWRFNEEYRGIRMAEPNVGEESDREGLVVHDWFEGRKKSLLADFVVGTIDHVLMGALRQKHLALRHLGLAGKVVIIDECHAYDAYMNSYLCRTLNWLGAYEVPVIILSATLTAKNRSQLTGAYLNRDCSADHDSSSGAVPGRRPSHAWTSFKGYPLITYSDGGRVRRVLPAPGERGVEIHLSRLDDNRIGDVLEDFLSAGGCAGTIVNTVGRAQELMRQLSDRFGDDAVRLLHSRFIAPERIRKEARLRRELGRSPRGTVPKPPPTSAAPCLNPLPFPNAAR